MAASLRAFPTLFVTGFGLVLSACGGTASDEGPREPEEQGRGSLVVTIQPYDGATLRTARYVVLAGGEEMAAGTAPIRDPEEALELSLSLPTGDYEVAFESSTIEGATCRANVGPVNVSADDIALADESWECVDADGEPL